MVVTSQLQVLASVKGLLESGDYSDLVITCGSDVYKVHKAIVCSRAEFFARAVKFCGKESQTDTIDLPEDEPDVVKLLIQYLYEGKYEPPLSTAKTQPTITSESSTKHGKKKDKRHQYPANFPHSCHTWDGYCSKPDVCSHHHCGRQCSYSCETFICEVCERLPIQAEASQLLTHAKMYELGDKYSVIDLKDFAKEKFIVFCKYFWDDSNFAIAANHAFSTTPEIDKGLRDVVSETIAKHIELTKKPEVRVLLLEFSGLALAVLDMKGKECRWGN